MDPSDPSALGPPDDESLYPRPNGEVEPVAADEQASPALSIQHLLLWTTALAIAAAWTLARDARHPEPSLGRVIPELAWIAMLGTMLAGAVLWALRRFVFQIPFPTQPGHWLLLGMFAEAAALELRRMLIYDWRTVYGSDLAWAFLEAGLYALGATIFFLAARSLWQWRAWCACFACLCFAALLVALFYFLRSIDLASHYGGNPYPGTPANLRSAHDIGNVAIWWSLVLAAVSGAIAIGIDIRCGARRDWLHYVGIATPLAIVLTFLCMLIIVIALLAGSP